MSQNVVLAENRRTRCAVELATHPSAAEQTGGEELSRYLEKLGGAPVSVHRGEKSDAPVRILIGAWAR